MDINVQSKQYIINSIVHSQLRLIWAFATIFDAILITFAYILSTFPQFVSFAIFKTVSKVKEKDVLARSSANLKTFLNKRFTVLTFLISYFQFSHTHTHKFRSWLRDIFSIASALFQDFLSNHTHIARIPFWFLETQGSTTDSIYGLLLLSRAPQDSVDTTVSVSRLFLLLQYKNCRNEL